ncbi:hypothetical protein KIH86_23185 [Paenibacillus sp. HN-1]|uniref:hypothetical protein n=1 Tax=Paenibacillus TaxID=44249 RepID=UPI001CA89B20|nr:MULTISPECIES: hypothetical protein [Paenibacillus]MBY9081060.1 hypothetical protein [Paenibacillus sp. CGMCC 1.18879]MBY9087097.1 hypothetical protein [Paenibacillus sinensis]
MAAGIVFAVRETEYIEPLLHYIQHSEYGEMLKVKAFSRMEAFKDYMKGGESPDAVVGDPEFIEAWLVEGRSEVPWAVLDESGSMSALRNGSAAYGRRIAKYQALPSLLSAVIQLCELKRTRRGGQTDGGPLVIGIVSPSGSSGKTTVAMNMAKLFGSQGLSVFYLNLEAVNSSGLYLRPPGGGGPGLERLLYEIQASREREKPEEIVIAPYTVRLDALRCDTFRPVGNVKEMLQMSASDARELITRLAAGGGYDLVLIDTGGIDEDRTRGAMACSDRLVCVIRDDEVSAYKLGRWASHLESIQDSHPEAIAGLRERSMIAVNFVKDEVIQIRLPEGVEPNAVLPYISSWSLPGIGELLLNSPPFQQGIADLCRAITGALQAEAVLSAGVRT